MSEKAVEENMTSDAEKRLRSFLESKGEDPRAQPLTPDASAREYFRVPWKGESRIACVYPEPFGGDLPFLDTSALFAEAGLPVAAIIDTGGDEGVVIQEDLGNTSLSHLLQAADESQCEQMIGQAITLIARIQAATNIAFERGSIASKLRFDAEKLGWELDFFLEHFFRSLRNEPLPKSLENDVRGEFTDLAEELEGFSGVLTHRDFHAANLLVGDDGTLRIIDHQDARVGSAAYDLVSLLLDRVTEAPNEGWLAEKRSFLLEERVKAGLEVIDQEDFAYEFDLVAVQRCLKAIGTFSNQAGNFGKIHYTAYIDPMFGIVSGICGKRNRFPAVREMILRYTGK